MSVSFGSVPSPSLTEEERSAAVLIHLSPLLGLVLPSLGGVLGPLFAWLVYRDRSRVLDHQGKEALNFQLSVLLYTVVITVLAFLLFGLGLLGGTAGTALGNPMAGGAAVMGSFFSFFMVYLPAVLVLCLWPLVVMVLAIIQVNKGQPYRYPLSIRFIR